MKKTQISLALTLLLSLSACDISFEDEDDSSNMTYVEGEVKNVSDEGLWLSFTSELNACNTSTGQYFESENVIVFGAQDYIPLDDFKYAATVVEAQFQLALTAMQLTWSEYINQKGALNTDQLEYLIDLAQEYATVEGSYGATLLAALSDTELATLTDADRLSNYFYVSIANLNIDEQLALQTELATYVLEDTGNSINEYSGFRTDKVAVCVVAYRSSIGWGEGGASGIGIGANTTSHRSDDAQIINHELIHHLQVVIAGKETQHTALERWFAEGQATYLSGMSISSGDHARNPLNVIYSDYQEYDNTELGLAYEDYGQAYEYIENTYGADAVMDMLYAIGNNYTDDSDYNDGSDWFFPKFETEFSNYITDLDTLRSDYPNISK